MPKTFDRGRDDESYSGTQSQREWLALNLDPLIQGEWITGVLYPVKSGKEATVY